ncbi:hypothetical protein BY996DRAFT_6597926 [Phakopsora pachyrhizi]|nr:hypothetical protein BY996DRAFT_6597926 [Phakopsora pachyrhizi]
MTEWEEGPKVFGTLRNEKERRQAIRPPRVGSWLFDYLPVMEWLLSGKAIRERVESIAEGDPNNSLGDFE